MTVAKIFLTMTKCQFNTAQRSHNTNTVHSALLVLLDAIATKLRYRKRRYLQSSPSIARF